MDRFVEIIDESAVRDVQLVGLDFAGFATSLQGWKKQSFYPHKGVVGQVMGEAQGRDGLLYLVQVSESIMVATLPFGLRDISFAEANRRYPMNMIVGRMDEPEAQERNAAGIRSALDDFDKMLEGFM